MKKIKTYFKENTTFVIILIICICLLAIFVSIATSSGAWPGTDASSQILSALAGAVVAAIITLFLLMGQTASEEKKERNTKVFEEKLRIYQEFLRKLCDVVKDQKIAPEEEIELEFQVAYIAMHTTSNSIKKISEQVRDIVVNIKSGESDCNEMLGQLFFIADTFYKELYSKDNDYSETDRGETIRNFRSILVAKDDIEKYVDDQKESIKESLSKKVLNPKERCLLLKAMIHPNGSKQWIYNENDLVHEFYTDISNKTGNYIQSKRRIVIDLYPQDGDYYIVVFTREYDRNQSEKLAKAIWGDYKESPHNPARHLYRRIPMSESNEEIATIMENLLIKVREYRDKTYKRQ